MFFWKNQINWNITECFYIVQHPFWNAGTTWGKCWTSPSKEYLHKKLEIRLYQVYVVFPLMRVRDNVVLLKKLSQSKGASRRTIIKLANIHARAQYLYEGNQKENEWEWLLKLCSTQTHTSNRVKTPDDVHCFSQEVLPISVMCPETLHWSSIVQMGLGDDFISMKHNPMYQNRDSDWELIMIPL